jgi:hypothetical protein
MNATLARSFAEPSVVATISTPIRILVPDYTPCVSRPCDQRVEIAKQFISVITKPVPVEFISRIAKLRAAGIAATAKGTLQGREIERRKSAQQETGLLSIAADATDRAAASQKGEAATAQRHRDR